MVHSLADVYQTTLVNNTTQEKRAMCGLDGREMLNIFQYQPKSLDYIRIVALSISHML